MTHLKGRCTIETGGSFSGMFVFRIKMIMIFNKKLDMSDFQKGLRVLIFVVLLFLVGQHAARSETYYKYVDESGTVVITQTLLDVPLDQREKMEEVNFAIEGSAKKAAEQGMEHTSKMGALAEEQKAVLKEMINEGNIKAVGEEAVRQGKDLFASFIEDQKTALIVYAVAGLAGFFMISKLMKRFVGGFVTKIVMKLAVVVVIFSGVYLLYLSWLSKSVLNFNPSGDSSEKNRVHQITTPREILEQTQDVVDQFNNRAAKREALLNGMDGN